MFWEKITQEITVNVIYIASKTFNYLKSYNTQIENVDFIIYLNV
jgi:hypothetical protein